MAHDLTTIYHLARDGEPLGQKSGAEIQRALTAGELRETDYAWHQGMPDWLPIRDLPALTVPPPPPGAGAVDLPRSQGSAGLLAPSLSPASTSAPSGPAYASLLQRFMGASLDGLLFIGPAVTAVILVDGVTVFTEDRDPSDEAAIIAGALFLAFAIIQICLISLRGQSLGKLIVGTRIAVAATGKQAGFLHGILLRSFVGGLPANIPVIGLLYYLVDICFIFREDRRTLHDLIGGTIVVKAR